MGNPLDDYLTKKLDDYFSFSSEDTLRVADNEEAAILDRIAACQSLMLRGQMAREERDHRIRKLIPAFKPPRTFVM